MKVQVHFFFIYSFIVRDFRAEISSPSGIGGKWDKECMVLEGRDQASIEQTFLTCSCSQVPGQCRTEGSHAQAYIVTYLFVPLASLVPISLLLHTAITYPTCPLSSSQVSR